MALATGDCSGGAPGDADAAAAPPPPLLLSPPSCSAPSPASAAPVPPPTPPPPLALRGLCGLTLPRPTMSPLDAPSCAGTVSLPRPRRGCCPTTPVALLPGVGVRLPVGRAGAGASLLPPLRRGGCKVWPWGPGCPPGVAALAAGVLPAARTWPCSRLLETLDSGHALLCSGLFGSGDPARARSGPLPTCPLPALLPIPRFLRVASPPRHPLAVPVRPRQRPPRRRSGKP
ncbi:hypothetical protein ACQJBY_033844 [Aegilops geniculata]